MGFAALSVVTRRLRDALQLADIRELDHLMVTGDQVMWVVQRIFRTFFGGSRIRFASHSLLLRRVQQQFHREVAPSSPLGRGDLP